MTETKGTFEERLQDVQEIITRIEEGKLSLEDSVKNLDEPAKMLKAIRSRIKKLMAEK